MGKDVARFAAQLPSLSRDVKEFKLFHQYVQLFYIVATKQIKQRFPIDNVLKLLTVRKPDTINSTPASNVVFLAKQFPNIIPEVEVECIDSEWTELQFMDPCELPSSSISSTFH